MQKNLFVTLITVLACVGIAKADTLQPLSLLIERQAPVEAMVGVETGAYTGSHTNALIFPEFYFGRDQLFNWRLFDTPVEFDSGRSTQLSLRNIDGSAWSVGVGINYNVTGTREHNDASGYVPGSGLDTFGPYAFTRYQATKAVGLELSERLDYYDFNNGVPPFQPKSYIQTETKLLLEVDLRDRTVDAKHPESRPKIEETGFYGGVYGFARQMPNNLYDNAEGTAFESGHQSDGTYGVGGRVQEFWKPWATGDVGVVANGEVTANTDAVYLSELDGYRSRGYFYPHAVLDQGLWTGGKLALQAGPQVIYEQFGESSANPIYFHAGATLSQAINEHVSVSLLFQYDPNPYKPNAVYADTTGPEFIGVSTVYQF